MPPQRRNAASSTVTLPLPKTPQLYNRAVKMAEDQVLGSKEAGIRTAPLT